MEDKYKFQIILSATEMGLQKHSAKYWKYENVRNIEIVENKWNIKFWMLCNTHNYHSMGMCKYESSQSDAIDSIRQNRTRSTQILFCVFCICFGGVVITAQCTETFSDLLCSPEFRYYYDVNMPIKVCSEAYFFKIEVL